MNVKAYRGFTMIEALILMIIITIASSSFTPRQLNLSQLKADLLIRELGQISQAIQFYKNQYGVFPGSQTLSNPCTNAIAVLNDEKLLVNVVNQTTPWGLDSFYTTKCDVPSPTLLTLSVLTNSFWASYIAEHLPNTQTSGASLSLNIQSLSQTPVLRRFLYLDARTLSSTKTLLSPSGTYNANADIDMDDFAIDNATITTTDNNISPTITYELIDLVERRNQTVPVRDATDIIGFSLLSNSRSINGTTTIISNTWIVNQERAAMQVYLSNLEIGGMDIGFTPRRKTIYLTVQIDNASDTFTISRYRGTRLNLYVTNSIITILDRPALGLSKLIIMRRE